MLGLRQLLNFTHAAMVAHFGSEEIVDQLLVPTEAVAAEPKPVKVVAQNREWLASLRAAGVPLPKVPV